jgi:choline dehydrogenase-like flavoprotein
MAGESIPRRNFLKGAGAAGAAAATVLAGPSEPAQAQGPGAAAETTASEAFLTEKAVGIARAANARIIGDARPRRGNFGANHGGAAYYTGGAIMGTDPTTSAVNRYLQDWEASNLFVMGGAVFPQNAGHNPTGTIGALTYWSAKAITEQYLKSPGPLVRA